VAYRASGQGVISFAGGMQAAFQAVYQGATASAMGFLQAGRMAMWMEDRDVNWNIVAFGCAFIAVLAWVLVGVGL